MKTSRIRYSILLSAGIQLALGAFTGHPYDERVFLTTGYLIAHGYSPYVPTDVSGVFGASIFPTPVPGIGYLPPWGFVLAMSYLLSYNMIHSLLLYNLATKVPIVVGNILLALQVGRMVFSETSEASLSRNATQFMLFNPYVIYTTAIWGQFDTVSVLLMLLSVYLLPRGKIYLSATALGASIAVKLIPIIILPLVMFHVRKRRGGWTSALGYFLVVLGVVGLSLVPFLLGWSLNPIIGNWNVHFVRIGGFSPVNLLLPFGILSATYGLELLGYLWMAALPLVYYLLFRRSIASSMGLMLSTLALMLTFSLTRAWVSEQNLNFVLPLVLIVASAQGWSKRWVTATWLLPLVFTFFNCAPFLMLFLVIPGSSMNAAYALLRAFPLDLALIMRASTTLTWLVVGVMLLKRSIVGSGHNKGKKARGPA